VNLYAYRATDPRELRDVADPIGPKNDDAIQASLQIAERVVCAWGAHPTCRRIFPAADGVLITRESAVRGMIARSGKPVGVLGLTKDGAPKHPLYLAADTKWSPWQP